MKSLRQRIAEENRRREDAWGHITPDRWKAIRRHAGSAILDVGCANGIYVHHLRAEGYTCYGVDLLKWPEWMALPDAFAVADAASLPFPNGAFETIISFEVLEHTPDPEATLWEYHRVCSQNIIISVPNCETPEELRKAGYTFYHWVDRTHVNYFTLDTLQEMIERCGFKIVLATLSNPTLPATLLLSAFGLPRRWAGNAGRLLNKISMRRYYMSLLAVAERIA